jgi:hypothetical protein
MAYVVHLGIRRTCHLTRLERPGLETISSYDGGPRLSKDGCVHWGG